MGIEAAYRQYLGYILWYIIYHFQFQVLEVFRMRPPGMLQGPSSDSDTHAEGGSAFPAWMQVPKVATGKSYQRALWCVPGQRQKAEPIPVYWECGC